MNSHVKRIQMVQKLQDPTPNYTPSIISGGESIISGSSYGGSNKPIKNTFQPQTIHEDEQVDNFSPEKESILSPKVPIKYSRGPCSSIISGKSGQSSLRNESRLSIASGNRILSHSSSLGGSKASLTSAKSYKSSIQQEFHDIKVQKKITSLNYGRAKRPFMYSMICFGLGGVGFFVGISVVMFRLYGQLFLSMDKGEIIGPIFIVIGLILISVGIKFLVDSYRLGAVERKRLGFRAAGPTMVTVKETQMTDDRPRPNEFIQSGSSGKQAIRKVLHPQNMMSGYPSNSVLR